MKSLDIFDRASMLPYNYLYTASIATQAADSKTSGSGMLLIGMVIVIVAIVGFIITKNKG